MREWNSQGEIPARIAITFQIQFQAHQGRLPEELRQRLARRRRSGGISLTPGADAETIKSSTGFRWSFTILHSSPHTSGYGRYCRDRVLSQPDHRGRFACACSGRVRPGLEWNEMKTGIAVVLLASCTILCGQDSDWGAGHRVYDNPFAFSPWPINRQDAARITREQVVDFLCRIGIPHLKSGDDIEEFQFAALVEGKMHLVAVAQGGGTIGANLILIAHCDGAKCVEDTLGASPPIDLATVLVSVPNGGVKQLLTSTRLGGVQGLMSAIVICELYELGPKGPENTTKRHRDWVRARMARMNEEAIGKAESESYREILREGADYAIAEFDDKTGITTNSLLKRAVKWSESDHEEVQELAVWAIRNSPSGKLRQQVVEELKKSIKRKELLEDLNRVEREQAEEPDHPTADPPVPQEIVQR